MTLLFYDGLQDGTTVPKPEWDNTAIAGLNTATGRDGSTNGAVNLEGGSAGGVRTRLLNLPTAAATCFVGTAFRIIDGMTTQDVNKWLLAFYTGGVVQLTVVANGSGFLEVRRTTGTGTLLGTTSGHVPIALNAWQHLQVKTVLHTSAGSCEIKMNGVTVLTLSGIATSSTSGSVNQVSFRVHTNNHNHQYDDMWVCDAVDATATQGRANNDYLGDLKVATLLPTSEGASLQWSLSTGTVHWSLVDEVPPTATDYVFSSTTGQRDLWNVTDLPVSATTVYAVRTSLSALKSDAGASSIKPLVRDSSTVSNPAAQPLLVTQAGYCGPMHTLRPSDSTVWSVADVNAMQAGVELA